jgi:hypothetical protein
LEERAKLFVKTIEGEKSIMAAATKHYTGKEFLRVLFYLEGKVALVIGGIGVLWAAMAWGLPGCFDRTESGKSRITL